MLDEDGNETLDLKKELKKQNKAIKAGDSDAKTKGKKQLQFSESED